MSDDRLKLLYDKRRRLELRISDMMAAGEDSPRHWQTCFNVDLQPHEGPSLRDCVQRWLDIDDALKLLGEHTSEFKMIHDKWRDL